MIYYVVYLCYLCIMYMYVYVFGFMLFDISN